VAEAAHSEEIGALIARGCQQRFAWSHAKN
jgi:hypothetical protein